MNIDNPYILGYATAESGYKVDGGLATEYLRADGSIGPVTGGLATATPLANGTAAVGVSTLAAREDHVHPKTGLKKLSQLQHIRC